MRKSRFFYAAYVALSLLGCQIGENADKATPDDINDGNAVTTVSGTIDTGTQPSIVSRAAAASSDYKIGVFQSASTLVTFDFFENYTEYDVAADGNFSISLQDGDSFVAFLLDPSSEFEKVMGLIGIGTGGGEYWESIDTGLITGNLELGTIAPTASPDGILATGNDLSSLSSQVADIDKIRSAALTDNTVRFLKNQVNAKGKLQKAEINYVFVLKDTVNPVVTQAVPSDYGLFDGYQLVATPIKGTNADGTYMLYDENTPAELYPPDAITGTAYDASNPIVSSVNENGSIEFGASSSSSATVLTSVPEGMWTLKLNGIEFAHLDYASARLYDSGGHIIVPVPVCGITIGVGSDLITAISLKWYLWNGTSYVEVDQDEVTEQFTNTQVEVGDYEWNTRKSVFVKLIDNPYGVTAGSLSEIIDDGWHLNADGSRATGAGQNNLATLSIKYWLNGMNIRFNYEATAP